MTETLSTIGDRTALRIERRLAHPPEKVWRALTEPPQLRAWFPFDVQLEPAEGATIRFLDRGDDTAPTEGVITELDPPRLLAYTWGDDVLRWELRPAEDGSLLIFTHTFADRAGAASFAAGWEACLNAMDELLAGRPVTTPDPAAMDVAHERNVAAFGLADGVAETTPDGWRVRFERQLVRPAETVWAAGTGGETPVVGAPVPPALTAEHVPAARVTAVDPPKVVEFDWAPADRPVGRVRWELGEGTGQGARLVLTQNGPPELTGERDTALTAWRDRIERLAAELLDTARPGPRAGEA
jgi:uncharacterized protein YndB with AHSA1/START domain